MLDLVIALVLALSSPGPATPFRDPESMDGRIMYYSSGWDWTRIARNQGVEIPPGLTPIARPDCATLGSTGWIALPGLAPLRWIQVDCTASQDLALVLSRGIVAEIPYSLAQEIPGMLEDGWVMGTLTADPHPTSPAWE